MSDTLDETHLSLLLATGRQLQSGALFGSAGNHMDVAE